MPTVVLTGFGPFPGAAFNPTSLLVHQLATRRRQTLADIQRIAHVFPTSYAAVEKELPALISRHRPDAVLMFGLAPRTLHLRIETRARNAASRLAPDVKGQISLSARIKPGGPALLGGRAPFAKLLAAARGARVPVHLSCNAGSYLCNYLYWRALEAKPRGKPPLVVFVHVPPLRKAHVPRGRSNKRRLSSADLARAGEAILLALVSATRARN
jgi:pyroglutamyl-peptidase